VKVKHVFKVILIGFLLFSLLADKPVMAVSRPVIDGFILKVVDKTGSSSLNEKYISRSDLGSWTQMSVPARGKPENPLNVWTGVALCQVLKKFNIPLERINRVSVSASDGYMAVLTGDLLEGLKSSFCATGIRGQAEFPAKYGYMRLIFPDLPAMYWVNEPVRVDVLLGKAKTTVKSCNLYFPMSRAFKEVDWKAALISIADILYRVDEKIARFQVLAADGLLREYFYNKIVKYMMLQKDGDRWEISGLNVPVGLRTKKVFFLMSGEKLIFLKQLSAQEKLLWTEKVWEKFILNGSQPDQFTLQVMTAGRVATKKVIIKTPSSSFYDEVVSFLPKVTNFDYIRVTW